MNTRQKLKALAASVVVLTLPACTTATKGSDEKESPAVVSEIEGSDLQHVTLTEKAVERVGLEMGAVAESAGTKTVPYASVVYDQHGAAWVYTSPASTDLRAYRDHRFGDHGRYGVPCRRARHRNRRRHCRHGSTVRHGTGDRVLSSMRTTTQLGRVARC